MTLGPLPSRPTRYISPGLGDRYGSFEELRRAEREGVDFRIRVMRREASVAIIAPHGGK
jgi:phage replication-related protein YjqB (UPF0714/DUF867 family)